MPAESQSAAAPGRRFLLSADVRRDFDRKRHVELAAMVPHRPRPRHSRYRHEKRGAPDACGHQRRDNALVCVAADPQGPRGLTRNGCARGAGEVAAKYHERYVWRCVCPRCRRDLDQVPPGRAARARGARNMGRVRPGVRSDPCRQQATGGHKGRVQNPGEMQEPAPFMLGLEPGVMSGGKPVASPAAIEIQVSCPVKGAPTRALAALFSMTQADIVGTIDVAVGFNGRALLIAWMAGRRRGHQAAKLPRVGNGNARRFGKDPPVPDDGHRGRDAAVGVGRQAHGNACRRVALDDHDIIEQDRIGLRQFPQAQARIEKTAADTQSLGRRGNPVRMRIEILSAMQDVAEQAGCPVRIFRPRLAQSLHHLPVSGVDIGGAVAEAAILRVTFGQIRRGALVLVEIARDDHIEDAGGHEGKRVARDPLVNL